MDNLQIEKIGEESFANALRHGMTEMYTMHLQQMRKLTDCENLAITTTYKNFTLYKRKINKQLLLICICDNKHFDATGLREVVAEFETAFSSVNKAVQTFSETYQPEN